MENFCTIPKCDVWERLQAGKAVFAVILKSKNFTENLYDLRKNWGVTQINRLLSDKEKNIAFLRKSRCKEWQVYSAQLAVQLRLRD